MTALLFLLQLNQLPSLYNPVNPPFGIGRMPERGLLISPPGEGALHSQSGAVSRGLQAEDIRLPGVAGCYSFFCVVSSGTYVGKSRKSDAPGDTSSAVRRSAQEPTEATSQNQPGSVGILAVQREEDVNRRFSLPSPSIWALSRSIHATTSFDAAVAVPGEIYSMAMNSLPHRN